MEFLRLLLSTSLSLCLLSLLLSETPCSSGVTIGAGSSLLPGRLAQKPVESLESMALEVVRIRETVEDFFKRDNLNHFLAGVAAGVGEWVFGHPFDTLKVRTMASANAKVRTGIDLLYKTAAPNIKIKAMDGAVAAAATVGTAQAQAARAAKAAATVAPPLPVTAMSQVKTMLKNPLSPRTGFLSLYRGSISELTSAAVGNSMLFGVNHYLRTVFDVSESETRLTPGIMMAAAGTGLVDAVVYKPLEYMKVQMQMKTEQTFQTTMRGIYDRGGILLFYRGMSSSILRDVVGNMGFFSTYHVMKHSLGREKGEADGVEMEKKAWFVLLSGATAGVVYELVSFPFETAAVVMQLDHSRNAKWPSALHCVRNIYRDRGFVGLYRGIGPTLVRALPAYAASFYMYEKILDVLKDRNGRDQA